MLKQITTNGFKGVSVGASQYYVNKNKTSFGGLREEPEKIVNAVHGKDNNVIIKATITHYPGNLKLDNFSKVVMMEKEWEVALSR